MPDVMRARVCPEGWHPMGTHIDKPVRLEFSEETGEDGLPLWERPLIAWPCHKHRPHGPHDDCSGVRAHPLTMISGGKIEPVIRTPEQHESPV